MLSYVTVGVTDLDKAAAFYEPLFKFVGAQQFMDMGRIRLYGQAPDKPMFAICTPEDGKLAACGNGTMAAFSAPDRDAVDKIHAKALEMGGKDEGAPGLRGDPSMGFYIGYFRDLDGNKLAVVKIG